MRLSAEHVAVIRKTVEELVGSAARILVFGSRLNDAAKGGDVDLLIETDEPLDLIQRARLKLRLEERLGLPVDVVVCQRGTRPTPFQTIAKLQGKPL